MYVLAVEARSILWWPRRPAKNRETRGIGFCNARRLAAHVHGTRRRLRSRNGNVAQVRKRESIDSTEVVISPGFNASHERPRPHNLKLITLGSLKSVPPFAPHPERDSRRPNHHVRRSCLPLPHDSMRWRRVLAPCSSSFHRKPMCLPQ
jgi:hypothetical protein